MSTRTIVECRELADLWLSKDPANRELVIDEMGGEPSDKFLSDFASPVPVKQATVTPIKQPQKKGA